MNFSVTERESFKRCNRQWRLTSKNGQHLGPIVPPVYLSVGTLIHTASQQWLLDDPPGQTFANHVVMAAAGVIEEAHARYERQVGAPMSELEDQSLYEALSFARAMAENYQAKWGSPLPEGFRLVRPEQRALVPVPGTEHPCEACLGYGNNTTRLLRSGPTLEAVAVCQVCGGDGVALHYLDMRFDGIIVDPAGNLHVLEHKTYKNRPKEESLKHNDQFLAYMWGARQLGIGRVVGLAYDGLWRRDKVPKGKTFDDLFLRFTHIRPEAEFREFERLLPFELNEMYAKRQEVRPLETLPINRQWQGCYDCGVEPLCAAISRGENYDFLLQTKYAPRTDDIEPEESEAA